MLTTRPVRAQAVTHDPIYETLPWQAAFRRTRPKAIPWTSARPNRADGTRSLGAIKGPCSTSLRSG